MDSNPIIIYNLTVKQRAMLEIMWSLKTTEELQDFQLSLDPDDLRLSVSLIQLLQIEALDQIIDATSDYSEALSIIESVK